jgi:DNA polymerase V
MQENLFVSITPNQVSGFASPAESEREKPLDLSRYLMPHPAATFFMRAGGHWPEYGIVPGDLLIIDRSRAPEPDLLGVGISAGDFCLGRLRRVPQGWLICGPQGTQTAEEFWGIICHVVHAWV